VERNRLEDSVWRRVVSAEIQAPTYASCLGSGKIGKGLRTFRLRNYHYCLLLPFSEEHFGCNYSGQTDLTQQQRRSKDNCVFHQKQFWYFISYPYKLLNFFFKPLL